MHERRRLNVLSSVSLLSLLLATSLTACSGDSDPDPAGGAGGAIVAPESTGVVLNVDDVTIRGFVKSVDSVNMFKPTRGEPFWQLGELCTQQGYCDYRDYQVDTEAPPKSDGKARYDGQVQFSTGERSLFQKTSFVEWNDVTIRRGESLDYRWAYTRQITDGTVALAWFIDDAGKIVDVVVISSSMMLLYGDNLTRTTWMDGEWTAKEDFHGTVRFSLSAGLIYADPTSVNPAAAWPRGLLLLDKTVRVRPQVASAAQELDPELKAIYACTVTIESNKESLISPSPERQEVATMCPRYFESDRSDLGPSF